MNLIFAFMMFSAGLVLFVIWLRKRLLCRMKITAYVESVLTKELPRGIRYDISTGLVKKTWYRPILRYQIDGATYTSIGDEWYEFNFRYHVGQQIPLLVCADNPALCTQPEANHFRNIGLLLSAIGIFAAALMLYGGGH